MINHLLELLTRASTNATPSRRLTSSTGALPARRRTPAPPLLWSIKPFKALADSASDSLSLP
nr:MAG TPA: hypothetical protein [Caudoviricetes sp.]